VPAGETTYEARGALIGKGNQESSGGSASHEKLAASGNSKRTFGGTNKGRYSPVCVIAQFAMSFVRPTTTQNVTVDECLLTVSLAAVTGTGTNAR
jgi:hypothetical protein